MPAGRGSASGARAQRSPQRPAPVEPGAGGGNPAGRRCQGGAGGSPGAK